MKKLLYRLSTVMLLVLFVFTGCGEKSINKARRLQDFESNMNEVIAEFGESVGVNLDQCKLQNYKSTPAEDDPKKTIISSNYGSILLFAQTVSSSVDFIYTGYPVADADDMDGEELMAAAGMLMIPAGLFDEQYIGGEAINDFLGEFFEKGFAENASGEQESSIEKAGVIYTFTIADELLSFMIDAR